MRQGGGFSCLALVTDAFGGYGGIAQYNRDFFDTAAALPGICEIVILPRHGTAFYGLSKKITQGPSHAGRLRYAIGALLVAFRQRPGIVFCGHIFMAPLAVAIAGLARARLVIQAHGIEVWQAPSRWQRLAVEAADLVFCVSRHTRAAVLRWADIAPQRVVVVPNTVADVFTPGDGSPLRAAWGLGAKKVLLTVGRLDPRERYKGHDRVIEAIPGLLAQGHDIAYVVIGDGDDRERLARLAGQSGVSERVQFRGPVPQDVLVEAYRMADLYVMPSTGEGFGIAFIEAMACGTPALGLAVAGARDALADGALGIAAGEAELAAAIDRLLTVPRPAPHALAGQVRARFGREVFATRLALAFDRLREPAPA